MKRSELKRGTSQLKRSAKPMKSTGARAKRMRQGKVPPTQEESAWMDAAAQFCIVCWLQHGVRTAGEIHHLKSGDRRMGHLFSIGLCVPHHRGGAGDGLFISRHPWKLRFESAYGTETFLLEMQRQVISNHAFDCALAAIPDVENRQEIA